MNLTQKLATAGTLLVALVGTSGCAEKAKPNTTYYDTANYQKQEKKHIVDGVGEMYADSVVKIFKKVDKYEDIKPKENSK